MELKKEAVTARPAFKNVLIAMIVVYIISSTIMQISLINQVGNIEHQLIHMSAGHQ